MSSHDLVHKHTRTNSATRQGTQKTTLTKSQSVEDFRKKTQVNNYCYFKVVQRNE